MSAKVLEIRKCNNFGADKAIVNVLFAPIESSANKFAAAAFSEGERYVLSYDLKVAYPELNVNGVFNAERAFSLFSAEIGNEQPVTLWNFPISELTEGEHESVSFERNGQKLSLISLRPATYHTDRTKAFETAKRNLLRQIDNGSVQWND